MKAKRFPEEQIITVLKEAEAGAKTKELCRRHGVSEATFYNWKSKYARMTVHQHRPARLGHCVRHSRWGPAAVGIE